MAVDTMGHLVALTITPANEQERAQVDELCQQVQKATRHAVRLAWADQGYTGGRPRAMPLSKALICKWSGWQKKEKVLCCCPGAE